MNPNPTEQFVDAYIATWSTQDSAERQRLIDELYAPDAEFFADEPGDDAVQHRGRTAILGNITQVNRRLTQEAGLATRSTGFVENHDLLRVTWEMTTPDGNVAMTGMNLLLRNTEGQILRDYILIG